MTPVDQNCKINLRWTTGIEESIQSRPDSAASKDDILNQNNMRAIDREIEIHVWGGATKLAQAMEADGLKVRREGRVMRVAHDGDDTTTRILTCAAQTGAQVRRMHEYEASLEDLFLVIMENLGYEVKTSEDLLASPALARKVDAPAHMGGGGA